MVEFEKVYRQIQNAFMNLFSEKQLHEITVKMICAEVGIARTTFYNYFSDIYEVLESIENLLISDLKEINKSFFQQNFHGCKCDNFDYFYSTLLYIQKNNLWFRTLLNRSKDGQFIYKWKKIIKHDFGLKYQYEKIKLENEALVLEMIASGTIGAYMYWVNNFNEISIEVVAKEVLYKLCRDFI